MIIYPAIDLYEGKVVRLYKGNYSDMTVYSDDPVSVALDFKSQGAARIHIVDLEGARYGTAPNFETIQSIKKQTNLFCEIGGGIRSDKVISQYMALGIDRVILGTAAVNDPDFLTRAAKQYREKIAVGVDILDGKVAVKGWTEKTELNAFDFCHKMEDIGIKTIICTDISRDGAMKGTNRELYCALAKEISQDIIASGGVSDLNDVRALATFGIHGAIIGKAYYQRKISIKEAIEVASS